MQLTAQQNQQFRLLLRVCRRNLVAVPGYSSPFVTDMVPVYENSPAVLNALLAIAGQTDEYQKTGEAASLWKPYQQALSETQQALELSAARSMAVIAGAVLLLLLSLAGDDWQHHAAHLTRLVDDAGIEQLRISRPGLFLAMLAAHIDMTAFALGRAAPSSTAWQRWQLEASIEEPEAELSPHEITTGYPASLLSIISQLDQSAHTCRMLLGQNPQQDPQLVHLAERSRLRALLAAWQPPTLPLTITLLPNSNASQTAMRIARRTLHRAATLYHARLCGFHSNLRAAHPLAIALPAMLEDIVLGIRHLIHCYETDAISTANIMAWPLTLAGSECGSPTTSHLQADVLALTDQLAATFSISHLRQLTIIFTTLWQRLAHYAPEQVVTLENVARDHGFTIFLV